MNSILEGTYSLLLPARSEFACPLATPHFNLNPIEFPLTFPTLLRQLLNMIIHKLISIDNNLWEEIYL